MGVEGDGGVASTAASRGSRSILDNLERGDAVSVVLFDTASEIVYDGEFEKEAVLEALRDARPSWGGTDLRERGGGRRSACSPGAGATCGSSTSFPISRKRRSRAPRRGAKRERPTRRIATAPAARRRVKSRVPICPSARFFFRCRRRPRRTSRSRTSSCRASRSTRERRRSSGSFCRNRSRELAAKFPLEVSIAGRRVMEKEIEILPDNYFTETVVVSRRAIGMDRRRREETIRSSPRRRHEILHAERPGQDARSPSGRRGRLLPRAGARPRRGRRGHRRREARVARLHERRPGRGGRRRARARARPRLAGRRRDRSIVSSRAGARRSCLLVPELKAAAERLSRYPLRFEFAEMPQGFFRLAKPAAAPGFLAPFDERDLEALARLRFRSAALVRGVPAREPRSSRSRRAGPSYGKRGAARGRSCSPPSTRGRKRESSCSRRISCRSCSSSCSRRAGSFPRARGVSSESRYSGAGRGTERSPSSFPEARPSSPRK